MYVNCGNGTSRKRADTGEQVLLGIMSGAFGLAGWYFGRKPTSATSEAEVSVANSSMPWEVEGDHDHEDHSKHFKYQYHPRGDKGSTKNAPSALNTVVIPNVTLPRVRVTTQSESRKY